MFFCDNKVCAAVLNWNVFPLTSSFFCHISFIINVIFEHKNSDEKKSYGTARNYKLLLFAAIQYFPHCHIIIIIYIYFSFASHVFTDNLFYSYLDGGKTFIFFLFHSTLFYQQYFYNLLASFSYWRTCQCTKYVIYHLPWK